MISGVIIAKRNTIRQISCKRYIMQLVKVCILATSVALSGCSALYEKHVEWEHVEPDDYPVLSATGYASIMSQQGADKNTKMLRAIKASKLDAYRELTQQVYGQKIDGKQSLSELVLASDELKASVVGVVRGAKVVKSYPVGDDTYITELELDFKRVYDIYLSTARPKRIKKVSYF